MGFLGRKIPDMATCNNNNPSIIYDRCKNKPALLFKEFSLRVKFIWKIAREQ